MAWIENVLLFFSVPNISQQLLDDARLDPKWSIAPWVIEYDRLQFFLIGVGLREVTVHLTRNLARFHLLLATRYLSEAELGRSHVKL